MEVHPEITGALQDFIRKQHFFFVASAPLSSEGHVNMSPKGLESLCVLSPYRVAYLDLVGSGNETAAHLHENGRITLMFCAFDGPPNILRLYGRGYTVLPGHPEWDMLIQHFALKDSPAVRQIIVADITRVQTSCGFGVPLFEYNGQRDQLGKWAKKKGRDGVQAYSQKHNRTSIDGLPVDVGSK
jgi:hypothetical protein